MSNKEQTKCPFNHRELPNCDICEKLGCKHLETQQGWENQGWKDRLEWQISCAVNSYISCDKNAKDIIFEEDIPSLKSNLHKLFSTLLQQEREEAYKQGLHETAIKLDKEYSEWLKNNSEAEDILKLRDDKIREETLKEAVAYLERKNPERIPSSVMVDYSQAIIDLKKLK